LFFPFWKHISFAFFLAAVFSTSKQFVLCLGGILYFFYFLFMVRRFAALTAGVAFVALATVAPVLANTATSDVNVDVQDYLTFSAIAGSAPFGSGAGAFDLQSTGTNDYALASADGTITQLSTTTNSTDGYNVTAYANNANTRTTILCEASAVTGNSCGANTDKQITDNVQVIQSVVLPQEANVALNTGTNTGVALRLRDTGTSTDLRGAEEDTQWGTSDDNAGIGAAQALWASPPLGSGAAEMVYHTGVYSAAATVGFVDWFVGVASTQRTGAYSGTVTFSAAVN
jgi:hypothetical protein